MRGIRSVWTKERGRRILKEKWPTTNLSDPPDFTKYELAYIGKHDSKPFGHAVNKTIKKLTRRK